MTRKRLRQITFTLIISSLFTLIAPITAFANICSAENSCAPQMSVNPRLTYIAEAQTDLSVNSGTATVDCWVKGDVLTATKTKVIAELQLKSGNSWIAYGTWTETANAFKASVYETKSVKAGQTYRVKATYTVWEGSQSESIVVFTDEVTA